jgi:flagellar hook-basal body complex protein FliE
VSADAIQLAARLQAAVPGTHATAGLAARLEAHGPLATPSVGFGQLVSSALGEVNQQLLTSQTDLQQLATGNAQNLHQIMIRLEESRLSFQLLLTVRNRLLEAYQDVMKMQV